MKHRHRIVNYEYYQAEQICSIGSGAVKQFWILDFRLGERRELGRWWRKGEQISPLFQSKIQNLKSKIGKWNQENVSQVLAQRCAYLNRMLTI
jgi:hypothetical protein